MSLVISPRSNYSVGSTVRSVDLKLLNLHQTRLMSRFCLHLVNRRDSSRHGGCHSQNETMVGDFETRWDHFSLPIACMHDQKRGCQRAYFWVQYHFKR